jgi:hypothetical protein
LTSLTELRGGISSLNAGFDAIPEAGHFLQNTHGSEVAAFVLGRIGKE